MCDTRTAVRGCLPWTEKRPSSFTRYTVHLITLVRILPIVTLLSLTWAPIGPLAVTPVSAQDTQYSVWLVESCTFKDVPAGAFMPDRAYVPGSTKPENSQVFFQLPVNVGIIKGGNDVVVYDTGWKQQQYIQANNCVNWAPIRDQMDV